MLSEMHFAFFSGRRTFLAVVDVDIFVFVIVFLVDVVFALMMM